ncbi:hypothetical protein BDC45DRAFT_524721 [Circinella umbellata]|nr:hypothetical protein BDC45DRAFT_524721 [Circinella umbellata]
MNRREILLGLLLKNRPVLKTLVTRVITYIVLSTVTVNTTVYIVFRKPTLSVPKSKKK